MSKKLFLGYQPNDLILLLLEIKTSLTLFFFKIIDIFFFNLFEKNFITSVILDI